MVGGEAASATVSAATVSAGSGNAGNPPGNCDFMEKNVVVMEENPVYDTVCINNMPISHTNCMEKTHESPV